jgi:hypothetical protein
MFPLVIFAKADKDKIDQSPVGKIKRDVEFLSSANLEGRLTGSKGEQIAADYIENRFKTIGLAPYKSKYKWEFTTKVGMKVGDNAYFKIFDNPLTIGNEVIVMPYGLGSKVGGFALPKVNEPNNVWLVPMTELNLKASNTPQKLMYEYAKNCINNGASSIVFYNDGESVQDVSLLNLPTFEPLSKPVVVLNSKSYVRYIKPNLKKDWIIVDGILGFEEANATGKNVTGFIDNKAPFTVIVSASFDHLGNFGNMQFGADNNASGVAALLAIAEMLKASGLKRYNYLLIAFSGKEQDYQGSKIFLQQNEFLVPSISCMIDLDMLGRFNATTRSVYVKGVGTSPTWSSLLQTMNKGFKLNIDSSGYGLSDYTTFYKNNIPVLCFSTGYHDDYRRNTDVSDKLNFVGEYDIINYIYRIVSEIDKQSKLIFNKTNDQLQKLENQKLDLGIIPDFSYTDYGVKIATTMPQKKANIAGMMSGDIITKIGPFTIYDFEEYLKAMKKTEPGREVTIIVKRGNNEFKFFVVL